MLSELLPQSGVGPWDRARTPAPQSGDSSPSLHIYNMDQQLLYIYGLLGMIIHNYIYIYA